MPKRAASACSSSVFILARRTCGSRALAACSYAGAIIRQGPHHGAQKSTTIGMSLRVTCRSKSAVVSAMGCPSNSGSRHWPHLGRSGRRGHGTRLIVRHSGQTRHNASLMARIPDPIHHTELSTEENPLWRCPFSQALLLRLRPPGLTARAPAVECSPARRSFAVR